MPDPDPQASDAPPGELRTPDGDAVGRPAAAGLPGPPGPPGPSRAEPSPGPSAVAGPDQPAGESRPTDQQAASGDGGYGPPVRGEHHVPGSGHMPDPWHELTRLAESIAQIRPSGAVRAVVPAWRRRTASESRWPVVLTVAAALALQLALPRRLALHPSWLLPGLELALFIGLTIANPLRFERNSGLIRAMSVVLIVFVTAANADSAVRLIDAIIRNTPPANDPVGLLASGAAVWATNVVAFALWYWEFDRGGPVHRAVGKRQYPDLMFPQMASPELAQPDWEARFVDYLYLSFTNATAFSPTDVMPLARWAKLTMALQSAVSLAVGTLVIARAINVL
ncbi:MAG: hypothetical protein ACLP70_08255 [Streptosporangiaceae bacterium]